MFEIFAYVNIYITLWKLGQKLSEIQRKRIEYIYRSIYSLTRMKKLICPQADQKDEIWNGRSECLDIIATLSLGIDTKYSEDIKDHQIL